MGGVLRFKQDWRSRYDRPHDRFQCRERHIQESEFQCLGKVPVNLRKTGNRLTPAAGSRYELVKVLEKAV